MIFGNSDDVLYGTLKKVYDTIYDDFQNYKLDTGPLGARTRYSDDYFREKFKPQYGKTPAAYLTELRINYAKNLIKTYKNALKIYEIAYLCGFKDVLYFSRRFK